MSLTSNFQSTSSCDEEVKKYPSQNPNYIPFGNNLNTPPKPIPHFYSNPCHFYSNPVPFNSNNGAQNKYTFNKRNNDFKNGKYNRRVNHGQLGSGYGPFNKVNNRPSNKNYNVKCTIDDYILPTMLEDPWKELVQNSLEDEDDTNSSTSPTKKAKFDKFSDDSPGPSNAS